MLHPKKQNLFCFVSFEYFKSKNIKAIIIKKNLGDMKSIIIKEIK